MKVIILIILLLASSQAAQNTIQSTMEVGPADLLVSHVTTIQNDLVTEQFSHDQLYASEHDKCAEEISIRETAIADGEAALRDANDHYNRCQGAYTESQADLAQIEAYQAEIDSNLQSLNIRREQEHAEFLVANEQFDNAIQAVQGAFEILASFSEGNAQFVQITKNMATTFKTLVRSGQASLMAGPLVALVQLSAAQFDENSLNQVRNAFTRLQEDLVAAKTSAIEVEQQREESYTTTVEELNAIVERLGASQTQLTSYTSQMQACTVQEEAVINSATAKVQSNNAALSYANQMCSAFATEYENATNGRTAERTLLTQLLEFIDEEQEVFGDYGTADSDVFETYRAIGATQAPPVPEAVSFLQTGFGLSTKASKHLRKQN